MGNRCSAATKDKLRILLFRLSRFGATEHASSVSSSGASPSGAAETSNLANAFNRFLARVLGQTDTSVTTLAWKRAKIDRN